MATTNDSAFEAALEYASSLGYKHGASAASLVFDGNTSQDTYARILKGLDDGDPAILDELPHPDLSGGWADVISGPRLVAAAVEAASLPRLGVSRKQCEWDYDDICEAYEFAFSEAVENVLREQAEYHLSGQLSWEG